LNNNLFFFSKKKLYIYYGQKAAVIEKAFELSKHVPGYLPDSIQSAASSGHASMIFALEQDTTPSSSEESTVFVYRNQIANEKVVQNAFFKWVFSNTENYSTRFIDTWNKHLYLVSLEYEGSTPHLVLSRLFLDIDNDNIPRLDHRRNDVDGYTLSYSESTDLTTITTDHGLPYIDTLVFDDGEVLTVEKSGDDGTTYTVSGNYENRTNLAYSGLSYTSTVELSTAYLRDEGNNIHPGTLNLRYCVIQTYNSKQFDVDIDIHNRSKVTHSFNQEIADTREDHDWIGSSTITGRVKEHQVRVPVLGFNQDVRITISSSNPHPLNIASLQYSGKFKGTTRFHNS
jgi:hypothetical protein